MRNQAGRRSRARAWKPWLLLAAALVIALTLAACGSSSRAGGGSDSSSGSSSTTADSGSSTTATASSRCGEVPNIPVQDPDGVVASLPRATQALYSGYPGPVRRSPWATSRPVPGPWKIGLSNLAANSAFETNLFRGMDEAFAEAKREGLVTGSLQRAILPDQATETPAQQIAGYQAMIRNGVQGVIMTPLAGPAIAPAITAAGKQGVPTVILGNTNPSDYAIADNPLNIAGGTAATIRAMGGKGNIVIVRGLAGAPAETYGYTQIMDEVKACPDLHVVGTINGNWNNATAKTAMQQFLASHPQKIDGVLQNGIMGQGVIQAFQQVGRTVPPVSMVGGQAGDLSYFADNLSKGYNTGGSAYNGVQQAYSAMRVLLNTLAGRQPRVTDIPIQATVVTRDNVRSFVPPGATLNTLGDPLGSPATFSPQSYLDPFFNRRGGASHL